MSEQKHKRGPQRQSGRGRPRGPMLGLAMSAEGISPPLRLTPPKIKLDRFNKPVLDYSGEPIIKSPSRIEIDDTRLPARLIALAAGGIRLAQVGDTVIDVTAKQRQEAVYRAGSVALRDHPSFVEPDTWAALADPDQLLVVCGSLMELPGINGSRATFTFNALGWGLADPDQHGPGHIPQPASGLVLPAGVLPARH